MTTASEGAGTRRRLAAKPSNEHRAHAFEHPDVAELDVAEPDVAAPAVAATWHTLQPFAGVLE